MTQDATIQPLATPATPEPEFSSAPKRDWFRIITFSAIIIFAGLFVAAPAFQGTWLWDDDQEISANASVQSPGGLKAIWKGEVGADYLPVKTSFLWLEWRVFNLMGLRHDNTTPPPPDYQGNINVGYHAINALFHVLNALLIWNLFYRLKIKWAWLGGLLFAIHPILVESVAWVTEQKNTLSLIFMLLSMICYINFCERRRIPDIILSVVMFLLSALSKSAVIMLPFCLILYSWWRDNKFAWRDLLLAVSVLALGGAVGCVIGSSLSLAFPAIGYTYQQWWVVVIYALVALAVGAAFGVVWAQVKGFEWKYALNTAFFVLPHFIIAAAVAILTMNFQFAKAIGAELIPVGDLVSRIATAGMSTWFYLWKSIWPFDLIPIYPRWDVAHPSFMQLFVPWIAFFAVVGGCIYAIYRGKVWGRHVILGLGFFFGNLVPAIGIVTMSYMRITWVADHFVYISLIGVLGLVVAGAAALYEKIPSKGKPWSIGVGIVALFLLTWNAMFYSNNFLNESNMWLYTLSKNPDAWQAHSRFGKVMLDHGNTDRAFYHIQQSNRLRPDLAETNNNMGVLLLQKKRGAEGLPYFRRAVRLMPIGAFLFNYANALTQQVQGAEAVPAYERLLKMNGGASLAQYIKGRGSVALEALFSERGGVTLGDIIKNNIPGPSGDLANNNQNAALDRLLKTRLNAADYQRVLGLQGGAALRELIQLHLSDQLDEQLKNKSADNLEQLVNKQGGKALENLLRQRGVLDDILKQDGGDTIRAVFSMDAGNESFFGLRRARGSDAYEALVLAMRPDPLEFMCNSLTGGDKLRQLLNSSGSDMLMKFHAMVDTEAYNIITDLMGGDAVMRLQEVIAAANSGAAAAGDPSLTAQKLAEAGINDPSVVLTNYGAALMQAGRRDEAIRAYQSALMIKPIPDAMVNYAIVLTQSGRGKEALPLFEKLLQVDAYMNNPGILSNAGIALFQAGRKDEAINVLQRALQINPNMADVQRNLELIRSAQPASSAPSLQSAPAQIIPIPVPDPSQLPIPAIFQNK